MAFVFGLGSGIAASYFLDADRGRQRRALVHDKSTSLGRRAMRLVRVIARDFRQRAQGLGSRARHLVRREHVSDEVLCERIRAELGRWISHPHAVQVHAQDGYVTLAGPILSREVQHLVRRLKRFPGVRGLENRLEVHTAADPVPELQGERAPLPRHRNPLLEAWPPAARVLAGTAGAVAWMRATPQRNVGSFCVGTLGALLVWRALTNAPTRTRPRVSARSANGLGRVSEVPSWQMERADLAELDA